MSLNIVERSYARLAGQLEHGQIAPVGFLFLEKGATELIGINEFALRLFPLLGGIVSLFLFYYLTQACLSRKAGMIALAMFTFSSSLIYFASEVKPYSTDVTVALVIFLAEYSVVRSNGDIKSLIWLGVVGAIGIGLSFPSVFILGGFLAVWLPYWFLSRESRANTIYLTAVAMAWLAIFLPLYLVRSRPDPWMYFFWRAGFPPQTASMVQSLSWLIQALFNGLKEETLGLGPWWLAAPAFLVGCWSLYRTDRRSLVLLLSPIALAVAAAMLRLYPMASGRLLLFLVPSYLIVIVAGLDFTFENLGAPGSAAALVLTMILFLPPFRAALQALWHPPEHEDLKTVLDYIEANDKRGDEVYVYGASGAAFDFYTRYQPKYQMNGMTIVRGRDATTDALLYESDLQQLRGVPRAWIVISHWRHMDDPHGRHDDQKVILSILDRMGKRVSTVSATHAAGYLYNLATQ